jgi:hypothetical protein
MSGPDSEFESELSAALRRLAKQYQPMVSPGAASALATLVKQYQPMVSPGAASALATLVKQYQPMVSPGAASALATLVKQYQPMVAHALTVLTGSAEQRQQTAESTIRYRQLVVSASTDSTLRHWVVVQACVFVILVEVLLIGWNLAGAVSPEMRAKYVEIIDLIMIAMGLSVMIKDRRGGKDS